MELWPDSLPDEAFPPRYHLCQRYKILVEKNLAGWAQKTEEGWVISPRTYKFLAPLASEYHQPVITLSHTGHPVMRVGKKEVRHLEDGRVLVPFDRPTSTARLAVRASTLMLEDQEYSDPEKLGELWYRNEYVGIRGAIVNLMHSLPDYPITSLTRPTGQTQHLRSWQEEGVLFLASRNVAYLADEPGLGKTVQVLAAFNELDHRGLSGKRRVLILASKVGCSVWRSHIPAWLIEGYAWEIDIISHGALKANSKDRRLNKQWDFIVLDEAHHATNPETNIAMGFVRLVKANPNARVWLLSGTPYSEPMKVYIPLLLFNQTFPNETPKAFAYAALAGPDDVADRFWKSGRVLQRKAGQYLSAKPIRERIWVKVEGLPRFGPVSPNQLSEIEKQLRSGPLASVWHETGLAKVGAAIDVVKDLIAKGEIPVVVAAWHRDVLLALKQGLAGLGLKVAVIDGDTPEEERARIVAAFQKGVLDGVVLQLVSGGEAVTLTRAKALVTVEAYWTPSVMSQVVARVWRHGQTNPVHIIHLYAKDSIDEVIRAILAKKYATRGT